MKKQIQNSSDSDSAAPGSDISATVSKVNHSNGNIAATSNTAHLDCGTPDSKSSIPTENGLYRVLLQKKAAEYEQENKAGLTSPEQKNFQLKLLELLTAWTPDSSLPPKEAFLTAKSGFDKQCQTRIDTIKKASSALENAFTFMEEAFDEGQEMVVFVTELTMDPEASQFITENGCERYFKYNKTLLVGNRRAAILKELDRDAIYSNPNEYEFCFFPAAKAQPTVNKRNYICDLGARFGYERVEASIQTAATKVINIVSFIYCGLCFGCWKKTEFIYIIMYIENLLLATYRVSCSGICKLNQNFKGINYIPQKRFLRK